MMTNPYLLTVLGILVVPGHALGGIVPIPDALGQTGNFSVDTDIDDITGEESVYLTSTMTISNPSGEYLFGNLFLETSTSSPAGPGAQRIGFGNVVNTNDWGINGNTGSTVGNPVNFSSGVDVLIDTPTTMVLKLNQVTGDWSFWLNPDLSMPEPPEPVLSGNNSLVQQGIGYIRLRGGRYGSIPVNTNLTDFTNVALYTGEDSPFNVVPPRAPALKDFSYDPDTGLAEVTIEGNPSTTFILIEAGDLDFENPVTNPVPLLGATTGTLNQNEITTDDDGKATVLFNPEGDRSVSFFRVETPAP